MPALVSVVMPVHNGALYVAEAIDSILNQTFTDFEFIIINDGSTDTTESVIRRFNDERISYFKNEKKQQIVNTLNFGVRVAKGRYIARMDADDISHAERLAKQVQFMESRKDIAVCGTWVKTFGDSVFSWRYPVSPEEVRASLLFYCPVAHPSVLVRKVVFERFQYANDFHKSEDYKLWCDVSSCFKIANIPETLLYYRLHDKQTSTLSGRMQLQQSNLIRSELIQNFGLSLDSQLLNVFFKLANEEKVNIKQAKKILKLILSRNNEVGIYQKKALKKVVRKYWYNAARRNSEGGLGVFFYYTASSGMPSVFNPWALTAFFLRCLLRRI